MDIRYVAGLFDGEGCVMVRRQLRGPTYKYSIQCSVTNTYFAVLDALQKRWGGSVGYLKKGTNNRPTKQWIISSRMAAGFLREIRSHLLIKAFEADLALEFDAILRPRSMGQGVRLSEEEKALREGYYLALRQAKRSAMVKEKVA